MTGGVAKSERCVRKPILWAPSKQVLRGKFPDREFAPKGEDFDKAVEKWRKLKSDDDAVFDKEITYDAADIEPMITYGTNPGMGTKITGNIPAEAQLEKSNLNSFKKSMMYMGFKAGEQLIGKEVDYVFVGRSVVL